LICNYCHNSCIKNGFQKDGVQRYFCKLCRRSQQKDYTYRACAADIKEKIQLLITNSCGVRDISRILGISKTTVNKKIFQISKEIKRPFLWEFGQVYEMDEIHLKINKRIICIAYAINRKTKQVIDFVVGPKTKINLGKVVNKILLYNPKKIYTDRYICYRSLIPESIHDTTRFQTNRIERCNLTLRTHLKRLHRRTLCYSKSVEVLSATLKIYFWGNTTFYL